MKCCRRLKYGKLYQSLLVGKPSAASLGRINALNVIMPSSTLDGSAAREGFRCLRACPRRKSRVNDIFIETRV